MCIDWNRNQYGECRCDILIDHIRLNLSVSFLIDLFRFFVEAVPYGQDDLVTSNNVGVKTFNTAVTNTSGLVNYAYVAESIDVSMRNTFFYIISLYYVKILTKLIYI